jgi:ubiquitin-activating enzyme E1
MSASAAKVVMKMNPALKIDVRETKVWPGTENEFDDTFWESLDGVWNALDNVHARVYTDGKCRLHGLPLMESGTEGTAGSTDVFLPHKTGSYVPSEGGVGVPVCTLKLCPATINHCSAYARALFFDFFKEGPSYVNKLKSGELFDLLGEMKSSEQLEALNVAVEIGHLAQDASYEKCILQAYNVYNAQFVGGIKTLIGNHPENERVMVDGIDIGAYWSGGKRFPAVLDFNGEDAAHVAFMHATSNLYAFMTGQPTIAKVADFAKKLATVKLPAYKWAKPSFASATGEEGQKVDTGAEAKEIAKLIAELKTMDLKAVKPLIEADFEKDDDSNNHIDFMSTCANLRAANYRITPTSRMKVKITAGRILSALATTTSSVCGLMAIEYYKVSLGLHYQKFSALSNTQINLGTGSNKAWSVGLPKTVKPVIGDKEVYVPVPSAQNQWTHITVDAPGTKSLTIGEFCTEFERQFPDFKVTTIEKPAHAKKEKKQKSENKENKQAQGPARQFFYTTARVKGSAQNLKKVAKVTDPSTLKGAKLKMYNMAKASIARVAEANKFYDTMANTSLIDAWTREFGELITDERRYITLNIEVEQVKNLPKKGKPGHGKPHFGIVAPIRYNFMPNGSYRDPKTGVIGVLKINKVRGGSQ